MPRSFAHLSDEAVVALVARSDQSALAELYDRFGGVAYGLALRILRDEALAQDAVQEAFAKAIRKRSGYRGSGPLEAWLWRLVVNEARDTARPYEPPMEELLERGEARTNGGLDARDELRGPSRSFPNGSASCCSSATTRISTTPRLPKPWRSRPARSRRR